ncbi:DUF4910 domain-containing protein [Porticoccaceae bacterium]|nr:DUF4910 domain-containing protein [Porticoccaceae bacterium]
MSSTLTSTLDESIFEEALSFAQKIFPYHKSVTGEGIDLAFEELKKEIGCLIHEYPTGELLLDWQIPKSWKCKGLSIKNLSNNQTLATLDHPLRVASHSDSFRGEMLGSELKLKITTSAKVPHALSHQYIYYTDGWSISLTQDEYDAIEDSCNYLVDLESEMYDGTLKVAELAIKGCRPEMLFLSHMCHPAQFNDGLVGVLVNVYLIKWLNRYAHGLSYTYKFLFMPETIGSHAYCSSKVNYENSVMAVFTEMLALDAPLHIQMSESEDDLVNVYLKLAAKSSGDIARFSPYLGVIRNDEKVFGAPGIEVPSASVTRALGREYEDHPYVTYHTSEDNVENSDLDRLKEALSYLQVFILIMEKDCLVERQFDGIPMLSRHGLFFNPQTHRNMYDLQEKMVWQLKRPKTISRIAVDLGADFFEILDLLSRWEEKNIVKFTSISKEM